MSRDPSLTRRVRPQLESLEGRLLPSAVAPIIPGLATPVQLANATLNTQLATMNRDFSKLQSDVANSTKSTTVTNPNGTMTTVTVPVFTQTIAQDYTKLGQDLGIINALNSQVRNEGSAINFVLFATASTGLLDSADLTSAVFTFFQITSGVNQADNTNAQANGIAGTAPSAVFPSLNGLLSAPPSTTTVGTM
jgi:hypothetical protein